MRRNRRTLALWSVGLLLGCAGTSGESVSEQLVPGLRRDEVLELIAQDAQIELVTNVELPPSGRWEDAVEDRALLGAILSASVRSDDPFEEVIQVRRYSGGFDADDFVLFLDDQHVLVHHQRSRSR